MKHSQNSRLNVTDRRDTNMSYATKNDATTQTRVIYSILFLYKVGDGCSVYQVLPLVWNLAYRILFEFHDV